MQPYTLRVNGPRDTSGEILPLSPKIQDVLGLYLLCRITLLHCYMQRGSMKVVSIAGIKSLISTNGCSFSLS